MALIPRVHHLFDHRITIDPVKPGVWRYRVVRLRRTEGSTLMREAEVVADDVTYTKINAWMRGRDIARRRRRRRARWPHTDR